MRGMKMEQEKTLVQINERNENGIGENLSTYIFDFLIK